MLKQSSSWAPGKAHNWLHASTTSTAVPSEAGSKPSPLSRRSSASMSPRGKIVGNKTTYKLLSRHEPSFSRMSETGSDKKSTQSSFSFSPRRRSLVPTLPNYQYAGTSNIQPPVSRHTTMPSYSLPYLRSYNPDPTTQTYTTQQNIARYRNLVQPRNEQTRSKEPLTKSTNNTLTSFKPYSYTNTTHSVDPLKSQVSRRSTWSIPQDQPIHSNSNTKSTYSYSNLSPKGKFTADPNTKYQPGTIKPGQVLGEYITEFEVKCPKKVLKETTVNKEMTVPEKIRREETIEETRTQRETIIHVEKKMGKREKIVEVPETVYTRKEIPYDVPVYKERTKHVPKEYLEEKITYVPKVHHVEREVFVDEIEYRDVEVEKIVEVHEIREELVLKDKVVPRYVSVPVKVHKDVKVYEDRTRNIPEPVEKIIHERYSVPKMSCSYEKIAIPIFAPRFVEVAVPIEQMDEETAKMANSIIQHMDSIADCRGPSLCDYEKFGLEVKAFDPRVDPTNAWSAATVAEAVRNHRTMPRRLRTSGDTS